MRRTERLKHISQIRFSNVDKKSVEGEQEVRLCNYTDVYYNDLITESIDFMQATAPLDQVDRFSLCQGDVLITKDSETAGDIAIPALVAEDLPGVLCGYHLALIRASRSRVHPAYLFWALTSSEARQQFSVSATGVTRFGLRQDSVGDVAIPVPPLAEQRQIADYLDAETARIDNLIAKKRRMIELLDERRAGVIEQEIRRLADEHPPGPLKHSARRIEVGIVITPSVWYAAEGVIALRGLNVRPAQIVLDEVVKITEEGHRFHRKSTLHAGDVVVVRTGQAGAAAVVPTSLDGSNCIDLVIVRPKPALLPKYLEYVLNSDWTQKHIDAHSVGTIQSHFNVGAMKDLPVPIPPVAVQGRVVEHLNLVTGQLLEVAQKLRMQIDLVVEHRQALTTAAVAGDLEIRGAAA